MTISRSETRITEGTIEHNRTIEHTLDTPERFDRSLFIPGIYDRPGRPFRLRIDWSENWGTTDITEEDTTSERPSAEGSREPASASR